MRTAQLGRRLAVLAELGWISPMLDLLGANRFGSVRRKAAGGFPRQLSDGGAGFLDAFRRRLGRGWSTLNGLLGATLGLDAL